jgi:ketosteroid isomerase-like protein
MSQENVAIVRAAVDAYNRGDVDGAFKAAAPEFEYDQTRAVGMDRGVFNLDEFRDLLATFTESWVSFTIGADELIDGGEHVMMPVTNRAQGRAEIEVQARGIWIWRSATARTCGPVSIRSCKRPSKPAGWTRRCRRRTWRSCAGLPLRTTAVTSTGGWRTGRPTPWWTGPVLAYSMQASIGGTARSGRSRRSSSERGTKFGSRSSMAR